MAQKVTAPTRQPRVGGIKSVIGGFIQEDRLTIEDNLVWEDSGCGFPSDTRAGCYDNVTADAPKEFGDVAQLRTIGPAFTQVAGVQCWLGGDDDATYMKQAADKLEATEDRKIESNLWEWAAQAADPVAAVDLVAALAAVEDAADEQYVGAPLILVSRANAVLLKAAGALEIREGGAIHTANGNRVIASASFGSEGITAVGWPAVYATRTINAQAAKHNENIDAGLAERTYAIGVDCEYRFIATV